MASLTPLAAEAASRTFPSDGNGRAFLTDLRQCVVAAGGFCTRVVATCVTAPSNTQVAVTRTAQGRRKRLTPSGYRLGRAGNADPPPAAGGARAGRRTGPGGPLRVGCCVARGPVWSSDYVHVVHPRCRSTAPAQAKERCTARLAAVDDRRAALEARRREFAASTERFRGFVEDNDAKKARAEEKAAAEGGSRRW
jgi:hypothetical protein